MVSTLNQWMVGEYSGLLQEGGGLVVLCMEGLTVQEAENIRDSVRETGARLRVIKNRLARVALESAGIPLEGVVFQGACGMLVGDPEATLAATKAIEEFSKKGKERKITYRGAWFDGTVMDAAQAALIAAMPDRQTLRGMICSAILGPARMLATAVREVPASTARCLQARADQEEAV